MEAQNKKNEVFKIDTAMQPTYFKAFQCLGGDCNFNCCQGWDINVSRQDYMKLKNARKSPDLQKVVSRTVKRIKPELPDGYAKYVFDKEEKCGFLDEAGFCRLQLECGPACLPKTCKDFPRVNGDGVTRRDRACSLGCEAVLALLLREKEGLAFESVALNKTEHNLIDLEECYQRLPITRYFNEVRQLCIGILQNRNYSLDDRMILGAIAIQDLDQLSRDKNWAEIPAWLKQKDLMTQGSDLADALKTLPRDVGTSVASNMVLLKLMMFEPHFSGLALKQLGARIYLRLGALTDAEGNPPSGADVAATYEKAKLQNTARLSKYEYFLENIMVNQFFLSGQPCTFGWDKIGQSYTTLCAIYSFFKFVMICGLEETSREEDLVHLIVVCARCIIHNTSRQTALTDALSKMEIDSLAHLAVIIRG